MSEMVEGVMFFLGGMVVAWALRAAADERRRDTREVEQMKPIRDGKHFAASSTSKGKKKFPQSAPIGGQVVQLPGCGNRVLMQCGKCKNEWHETLPKPVRAPLTGPYRVHENCEKCRSVSSDTVETPTVVVPPKSTDWAEPLALVSAFEAYKHSQPDTKSEEEPA